MRNFSISLFASVLLMIFFSPICHSASTWNSRQSLDESNSGKSLQRKEAETIVVPFTPKSHNLSINVGQVFLTGDLSDRYQDAIGTNAQYTYGVSDLFGFESSLGYSSHSEGKYSLLSLNTGLRTNLTWYDKIIPYAVFGLGFYRPSLVIPSSNPDLSANSVSALLFGVHLGPGVDLLLDRNVFFGSRLSFHDMFNANQKINAKETRQIGGSYITFTIHAGLSF